MVEARLGRSTRTLQFVGTPASVADRMGEVAEQIGGDGFLIHAFPLTRCYIAEITDGLVPELQSADWSERPTSTSTFAITC